MPGLLAKLRSLNGNAVKSQQRRRVVTQRHGAEIASFCNDVMASSNVRGLAKLLKKARTARVSGRRPSRCHQFFRRSMLSIKTKLGSHESLRLGVSDQMQIAMAASNLHSGISALAAKFDVTQPCAKERLVCHASFILSMMGKLLGLLLRWLDTKPDLEYASCSTMYDAAMLRLSVPTGLNMRKPTLLALPRLSSSAAPALDDVKCLPSCLVPAVPGKPGKPVKKTTLTKSRRHNHIIVYTGDGEGFVFESYVLRIGALLAHIFLGRNPVVPSLGKWTQLPDSADFILRFSLSGFGCRLFQYALAGALSSNVECQDVSDDFLQDLNWKALTGKKYKLALGNLTDADWTAELLIFVIAAEPLRILCSTYLKWSLEDAVVQCGGYSKAMDLISPRHSVLVGVLQYYSTLLLAPDKCTRLQIVYRHRGCTCFQSWRKRWPQDWVRFSKAVMCMSAAVFVRQWQYLTRALSVLKLGDERVPFQAREADANRLLRTRRCCLQHGLPRGFANGGGWFASDCRWTGKD